MEYQVTSQLHDNSLNILKHTSLFRKKKLLYRKLCFPTLFHATCLHWYYSLYLLAPLNLTAAVLFFYQLSFTIIYVQYLCMEYQQTLNHSFSTPSPFSVILAETLESHTKSHIRTPTHSFAEGGGGGTSEL